MTQILADASLAKQLEQAEGPMGVVNDKGDVIAVCTPVKFPHSPYSREEFEQIRQQYRETGEGRPLADILKRLQESGGGAR